MTKVEKAGASVMGCMGQPAGLGPSSGLDRKIAPPLLHVAMFINFCHSFSPSSSRSSQQPFALGVGLLLRLNGKVSFFSFMSTTGYANCRDVKNIHEQSNSYKAMGITIYSRITLSNSKSYQACLQRI